MKKFTDLIKADYAALGFVITGLLFFIPNDWVRVVSFTLFFTCFDVLGWKWMMQENGLLERYNTEGVAAYRIVQHGLFLFILILVALLYGWHVPLLVFILWMTGVCDTLYYFIGKYTLANDYPWLTGWFWIFPMGAFFKANGKSVNLVGLLLNNAIGISITIYLGILWF